MVIFYFLAVLFVLLAVFALMPFIRSILDLIIPLNESRPKISIFITQYYVDPQANYYWIFIHHIVSGSIIVSFMVCGDLIFMASTQHACGIFAAIG